MNAHVFIVCVFSASACGGSGGEPTPRAIATASPTRAPLPAPARSTSPDVGSSDVAVLPGQPSLLDLPVELEDQDGKVRGLRAIAEGKNVLVAMFFASCTYACPTLIEDVLRIDRGLGPLARAATKVVLVSFDVERDDPVVLRKLMATYGIPTDRWVLARARSDEGARELAGALGVTYRRLPDGMFNHTSLLTLLDVRGVPTARLEGLRQDATAFSAVVEQVAHMP